ncbi:hypothetical protein SVIOM74S_01921 [Streptomyces violarus]
MSSGWGRRLLVPGMAERLVPDELWELCRRVLLRGPVTQ